MTCAVGRNCVFPSLVSINPTLILSRQRPSLQETLACRASPLDSQQPMSLWNGDFYNRTEESAFLIESLKEEPVEILIVLGPKNSGKTRLLGEVQQRLQVAEHVTGEGPPPVLYLNCRGLDVTSPKALAENLSKLVTKNDKLQVWWKNLKTSGTVSLPGGKVDLEMFFEVPAASPLSSIIYSYLLFLEAVRPSPYKPVIVIDEANSLMGWKHEADPELVQLKSLLSFFVRVTKEQNLAHVVLATSEYFLVEWLDEVGLDGNQYTIHVIGDLSTEHDARMFVDGLISKNKARPLIDEETQVDMWPKVYEVCGGNIGLLRRAAIASPRRGWSVALDALLQPYGQGIENGLRPRNRDTQTTRKPPAWTSEEYKTALRAILDSKPYHAVLEEDLEALIDSRAFLSMVEWNKVALRPYSDLAKDLPREVFGSDIGARVVTMPSPADLYIAKNKAAAGKLEKGDKSNDGNTQQV